MTTIKTITDEQIQSLRDEAAAHGDREQVDICDRALAGSGRARGECVYVINAASAMDDADGDDC
jgi:hypothetical protein